MGGRERLLEYMSTVNVPTTKPEFEKWLPGYLASIRKLFIRSCTREIMDDAVQDVHIAMWQLGKVPDSPEAYVKKALQHRITKLRAENRSHGKSMPLNDYEEHLEDKGWLGGYGIRISEGEEVMASAKDECRREVLSEQDVGLLIDSMNLDDDEAEMLRLRRMEGLSIAEACLRMGLNPKHQTRPASVTSRLREKARSIGLNVEDT